MKRIVIALTAASLLAGCNVIGRRERGPTTPTVGERIPVLGREGQIEVDAALASTPVTVPMAVANPEWPQPGGNPQHVMVHVALPETLSQAWSVSIGAGSSTRARSRTTRTGWAASRCRRGRG